MSRQTKPAPEPEWLTLPVAAALGYGSTKTLRRRIADGTLPAYRQGPRLLRVKRADLDALLVPVRAVDGAA